MSLVLSLFPGIGLLDRAFEEEGFCIVRGPDLLWGGDVKRFHPPAGRFDGIIGGDPCQAHSSLRRLNEQNGYTIAEDLTPEFVRVIEEAQPGWFLRENVPEAPRLLVPAYAHHVQMVKDVWCGGDTIRARQITFGTRTGTQLRVETLALHKPDPERAVTGDARVASVGERLRSKKMGAGALPGTGKCLPLSEMLRLQGLPTDFFGDEPPFTQKVMRKMIGNGVPLAMGRAIAKAVKRALAVEEAEAA